MLDNLMSSLKQQIMNLRAKHVRERKKTSLFKDHIQRQKRPSANSAIRRSARVRPEVNAGMYDDERLGESSVSISNYLKRHKASRVNPISEARLHEESESSVIELRDLAKR